MGGWIAGSLSCIVYTLGEFLLLVSLVLVLIAVLIRLRTRGPHDRVRVAFFHPYCYCGGGGERVLWNAVRTLQNGMRQNADCVIYVADAGLTPSEIIARVHKYFGTVLRRPVSFAVLRSYRLLQDSTYPRLTLIGQSLGSMVVAFEALLNFVPDIYIDTTGFAFTLPIFRYLAGCRTACYVHYPTISKDMLQVVSKRQAAFNNAAAVSSSLMLTRVKLCYYYVFAFLYRLVGHSAQLVMVNSTWTFNHIADLWSARPRTFVLFPPCDCHAFEALSEPRRNDQICILSLGQFRPEKNHVMQLEVLRLLLRRLPSDVKTKVKMVFIGGCRNDADRERVNDLKRIVDNWDLHAHVVWHLNCDFRQLRQDLKDALVGIHTMRNEHFGIGIVEMMLAGVIVVAHNSGGPKLDIVLPDNGQVSGFLASTVDEYAECIKKVIESSEETRQAIRLAALNVTGRFSEEEFAGHHGHSFICFEEINRDWLPGSQRFSDPYAFQCWRF